MDTELRRVDLLSADLREADMSFTYLTGTKVTTQQLAQVASLEGATPRRP
jgi:uncharacterized protein YjbI with pentapeptide repeats